MSLRNSIQYVLLTLIFAFSLRSIADPVSPGALCQTESYVVGFFNGVWNTEAEAILATSSLEKSSGKK